MAKFTAMIFSIRKLLQIFIPEIKLTVENKPDFMIHKFVVVDDDPDDVELCFYEKPTNFLMLKEFLKILTITTDLNEKSIQELARECGRNQKFFV